MKDYEEYVGSIEGRVLGGGVRMVGGGGWQGGEGKGKGGKGGKGEGGLVEVFDRERKRARLRKVCRHPMLREEDRPPTPSDRASKVTFD